MNESCSKVISTHFTSKSQITKSNIEESKTTIQQNVKTLITEQNEILLLYSDPKKSNGNEASVSKFGGEAGTPEISLKILALNKDYSRFFEKHDPALFIDETIFL